MSPFSLTPDPHLLSSEKGDLRRTMIDVRAKAFRENPQAPAQMRDHFLHDVSLPKESVIAAYISRETEMDPKSLVEALRLRGYRIVFPVIGAKTSPLLFREARDEDEFVGGPLGIREPKNSLASFDPDILLIPLLAFDHHLYRLGYGGGYYDRTLAHLRAKKRILAIGLAYAVQERSSVPAGPYDEKLDQIVTENGVFMGIPQPFACHSSGKI